ncbi:MAG: hypothetical protein V1667_00765, partial [bacterium]
PLQSAAEQGAGFKTGVTFNDIVGTVITAALSLIGVLFLILAIYAGYNWMIARGEEEKVEKAKNTITRAIVGVIIIIAAYAISIFVMGKLEKGTLQEDANSLRRDEINVK